MQNKLYDVDSITGLLHIGSKDMLYYRPSPTIGMAKVVCFMSMNHSVYKEFIL